MAGRLSFSIAINLLTENFKKGTSHVQQSLKSMQMQVLTFAAAIGAGGIGLSDFISRLIDTARETNRVSTALKNVSGGLVNYSKNQKFLLEMSKKYGIEILSLTGNFAKFTAAAGQAGVSIEDQKKIFESVSRASVAFGLTADDTNLTLLAITQMMSKGKISSEELRRQLGERLPIAMSAMAKAAGVPIQKLDDLLKKGELMSNDVLPKFADALNSMIPEVNTDNIETSLNRLKNAFTAFTANTGIQAFYKQIIDSTTSFVQYVQSNLKMLLTWIVSAVAGYIGGKVIAYLITQFKIMERAALIAARKVARDMGVAFDEAAFKANRFYNAAVAGAAKLNAALQASVRALAPMAIIAAIVQIIQVVKLWRDAHNEVNNLYSNYRREAAKAGEDTEQIKKIKQLSKIVNDTNISLQVRKNALVELNSLLNTSYKIDSKTLKVNGDLNSAVKTRIKLLKDAAKADMYTNQAVQAESEINRLESEYRERAHKWNLENKDHPITAKSDILSKSAWGKFDVDTKNSLMFKGLQLIKKRIIETKRIAKDANDNADKYVRSGLSTNTTTTTTPTTTIAGKEPELQKAQEKYRQSLAELDAKLKLGIITQSEYNKSFDELNRSSLVEAMTMKDGNVKSSEYYKNLEKLIKSPTFNALQADYDKIQSEYNEKSKELTNQRASGAISEKVYTDKMQDLITSTIELTGSLLGADAKATEFYNNLLSQKAVVGMPAMKSRDKTFDYKKSKSDILGEDLDVAKENYESIKKLYDDGATNLINELNSAMSNVTSLEDALKIAQVKQDVQDLQKQLDSGVYSGVKDIASSADRMVSSFQSLRDVFSDVDSSGWERIMAVWNALVNTVDGFLSIIELINNLTEITNQLAKAKEAEAVIDTAVSSTKIANMTAGATAKVANSAVEIAASKAVTGAYSAEMAAKTAAAYAAIPFAGPGIAAAQIAALEALITAASIPKFENGGIVGGASYSGDKILTRLNSGEMVLNRTQQGTLFSLLNNGGPGGGSATVKIKGSDLYLAINNYKKQARK